MKSSVTIDLDLRLRSLVGRPLFWIAVVGVLFGAPLLRGLLSGSAPVPPPVLGILPRFDLQDDRGRRFSSDSVRGHAFIANLLCTGCGADGAVAAETMRKLQHRSRNLGDALWLVSFSPDGNASALGGVRLKHPSSERWFLAAGAPAPLRALFSEGKALLLIDQKLRVRGRYGAAPGDLDEALRDASLVIAIE
jgi:hypothetical protein